MQRADSRSAPRRAPAWGWLVTVSACLVVGGAVALAIGWSASRERRVTTYAVRGSVAEVSLDLGAGSAVIVGGGDRADVSVRRSERFAFGHGPVDERHAVGGALRIRSRCPSTVVGGCSVSYRLVVPDNVAVTVRTTTGDVRLRGYRGSARIDTGAGDIDVADYCGFLLRAHADSGDVHAGAACAPSLDLRSRSGDVGAVVPPGRYRVQANTNAGDARVRGLTATADATFVIQAVSATGDVDVEARR
jgi:hypothetical protein